MSMIDSLRALMLTVLSAAAVDEPTGDYYLFTKDREESVSEVYRYPFPQSEDLNPFTLGTRVL